jgi:superfamily I DNA/RNA helicase
VARTYPIVVIDEMQDVSGGRLQMAKGLSVVTQMLAAADGFQNLNNDHDENEAVQWLRTDGETRNLHENYRTKNSALLTAATLLREGETLQRKGVKFIVLAAYTANVGASYAATNLTWHGCSDVVFLSPTGPDSAPFVNDLIGRLHRPITPGKLAKEVGPFRIGWEAGYQQMNLQTLDALGVSGGALSITGAELSGRASRCRFPELVDWVDKQRRLYGRIDFAVQVVRPEAERLLRIRHSYSASREGGLRAMTIHQAKNREFRGVVVLWPFQVQGTVLKQRRLLYNAITRAKEWCAIIVQGNNDRISKPPFHGDRG